MDPNFWHRRWAKNEIAFHEAEPNSALTNHLSALALTPGARVFAPLSGKSLDLPWLASHGYRVAGAELSALAVTQFFEALAVTPSSAPTGAMQRLSAQGIDIYQGDFFALAKDDLGPVDAIYDRGALVALPEDMRGRYVAHLLAIAGAVPQLLVTYAYASKLMDGPPFSVPAQEVERHYSSLYTVSPLWSGQCNPAVSPTLQARPKASGI